MTSREEIYLTAYGISDGWAATGLENQDPGYEFEWRDKTWIVVSQVNIPCCSKEPITLVKAKGSTLTTWQSIPCSDCRKTYTFEHDTSS